MNEANSSSVIFSPVSCSGFLRNAASSCGVGFLPTGSTLMAVAARPMTRTTPVQWSGNWVMQNRSTSSCARCRASVSCAVVGGVVVEGVLVVGGRHGHSLSRAAAGSTAPAGRRRGLNAS
jgi:hypothetical protein